MFWDEDSKHHGKHDHAKEDTRRHFSGIDTIKIRKIKKNNSPSPIVTKKKKFWPYLFLFIIPIFIFLGFLGANATKAKLDFLNVFRSGKYIVLFQNNAELRPAGGFIGSFAVVEFSNYKIKNINFNSNIYKLDKAFTYENNIPPPEPMRTITDQWALRDANFAVSFPESAEKVKWFYEKESGEKIDGVIAVNASVITDLLKITGPIEMPEYKTSINADNFYSELALKIEKTYFTDTENKQENEPKTILKDLMPQLIAKAYQQDKLALLALVYSNLTEKEIQFYSADSNTENAILEANWGGKINSSDSDYLAINNANIGGMKSSLFVKENVDYKVKQENNILISNLTITRSHAGNYIWPDGLNNNWTRVLVPDGSKLQKAELNGRDITKEIVVDSEAGKTTFGFWINTAPYTSNVIKLNYTLPIATNKYHLLLQKQSGTPGDEVSVNYKGNIIYSGIVDKDVDIQP